MGKGRMGEVGVTQNGGIRQTGRETDKGETGREMGGCGETYRWRDSLCLSQFEVVDVVALRDVCANSLLVDFRDARLATCVLLLLFF